MSQELKDKLKATLASRKFWGAVGLTLSLAATAYANHDPFTVDLMMKILAPLGGWIGLEGIIDAAGALPGSQATPTVQPTAEAASATARANAQLDKA